MRAASSNAKTTKLEQIQKARSILQKLKAHQESNQILCLCKIKSGRICRSEVFQKLKVISTVNGLVCVGHPRTQEEGSVQSLNVTMSNFGRSFM